MAPEASSESIYDSNDFPPFAVTVDIALFTIFEGKFSMLLIERGEGPFRFAWALPGGFVRPDEGLLEAANRELSEETGAPTNLHLEQLGSYGAPKRDPRMRVVTVAYCAILPNLATPIGGTDALSAQFVPVDDIVSGNRNLAFDHEMIARDAIERTRSKIEYTTLAAKFCAPEFTIAELRSVYEQIWGLSLEAGNFQRKVQQIGGFLEPLNKKVANPTSAGRPPKLFRAGPANEISPPFKRNSTK
jgi:8-oxo-dGTP diphosphatase